MIREQATFPNMAISHLAGWLPSPPLPNTAASKYGSFQIRQLPNTTASKYGSFHVQQLPNTAASMYASFHVRQLPQPQPPNRPFAHTADALWVPQAISRPHGKSPCLWAAWDGARKGRSKVVGSTRPPITVHISAVYAIADDH